MRSHDKGACCEIWVNVRWQQQKKIRFFCLCLVFRLLESFFGHIEMELELSESGFKQQHRKKNREKKTHTNMWRNKQKSNKKAFTDNRYRCASELFIGLWKQAKWHDFKPMKKRKNYWNNIFQIAITHNNWNWKIDDWQIPLPCRKYWKNEHRVW